MDPALAARFGSSAQRTEGEASRASASPDGERALSDARRDVAAVLIRIYAAVESAEFGTAVLLLEELRRLCKSRCVGARAATLEGAPQLLSGALAFLEPRAAEEGDGVEVDGDGVDINTAAAACCALTFTLKALIFDLHFEARWFACAACAAAHSDAARQLAAAGGVAALARCVALRRDSDPTTLAYTLLALKRHGHADALPPASLAALEDDAFLAQLPVLVGGTFDAQRVTAAATLVAHVAWLSPRAAAAMVQPTHHPAIIPLLLAAVDCDSPFLFMQREPAAGAIGALARGAGREQAVEFLVHMPWAFDVLVEALLDTSDQALPDLLDGVAPFAREPQLRAAVASQPGTLHRVVSEAGGKPGARGTTGARRLLLMLLTCGDQNTALLTLGAVHVAKHGAEVLAWMQAMDASVAALVAAPGAARQAAAALAASERRAARKRTGALATEAHENADLLRLFADAPPAELRAKWHDEAWRVAMRRAALLLRLGNTCDLLLGQKLARPEVLRAARCMRRAAAVGAGVVANSLRDVMYSAGLFSTLRCPELMLQFRGDDLARALDNSLMARAIAGLATVVEERRDDGAAATCETLLHDGLDLPDEQLDALAWFLVGSQPGHLRAAKELVTAAAADAHASGRAAIVWRFVLPPHGSTELALLHETFECSTKRNAGPPAIMTWAVPPRYAEPMEADALLPALLCDVRACLEPLYVAAARRPRGPAAALLAALQGKAAAELAMEQMRAQGVEAADRAVDCANCESCRAMRRTAAKCARPACGRTESLDGAPLRRCARGRTAGYCGAGCQNQDWRRHNREDCVPKE